MRALISNLFDMFCNVMLAICTVVYFRTKDTEWGMLMIVYLIVVAFGDLQREIKRKMNLALHAHMHNWIFVDEEGKPVVITKDHAPSQNLEGTLKHE